MARPELRGDIGPLVASVARDLRNQPDVQQTLDHVVALAAQHLDGRGCASVSLVRQHRRVETAASSEERASRADALQYELRQGPCLDAIRQHDTVRIDDMASDLRYPDWTRRVVDETGLRSSLSLQLFTTCEALGALNLYGSTPHAFTEQDLAEGLLFAAQAAVALRSAMTEEQLQAAVQSRTVIGQAQGILMERYHITADKAFEVLRRASQDSNVRLALVAAQLVHDRRTPGT